MEHFEIIYFTGNKIEKQNKQTKDIDSMYLIIDSDDKHSTYNKHYRA